MSYKLTYFAGRGRAENARLLFAVAGVQYEDIRVESAWSEDWAQVKGSTPFGVLPFLTLSDGTSISMSAAIANYLAREFNLYGKDNKENTQVDTITNALTDIMDLFYKYLLAKEDAKAETLKNVLDKVEIYGDAMEASLKQNNGGNGYLVGKGLTLADIAFFTTFADNVKAVEPNVLDKYPLLMPCWSV
ncbi:S-crystallin 4-like [Antedon mediterranea]|uniref:S-crystallin 4-like n=1 Tax=Antedon mediterranea TaxID=105859 RepID=UPI003AF7F7CF